MKYLPIDRFAAKEMSQLLWQLLKSPSVTHPNDVTTQYCSVIDHPTRENVSVLALPDENVKIHASANGVAIQSLLSEFVGRGDITEQERVKISADVAANRGRSIKVETFLPSSWKQYLMTEQVAKSTGWIPE